MNVLHPVYVINLDRSNDRLENFTKQKDLIIRPIVRVSGIDGKKMSKEDVSQFSTQLCKNFCTPEMIGCFLSHIKAWNQIVENKDPYAFIMEDDCQVTPDFYDYSNNVLKEISQLDPQWDMIYLGYFGYSKKNNLDPVQFIGNIICGSVKTSKKINGKYVFTPHSPYGFHCYILSQNGAQKLISSFPKASGHLDCRVLSDINTSNMNIYASKKKIGNQSSTSINSIISDSKFPKTLNYIFDKFKDTSNISYGYHFNSPIIKINKLVISLNLIFLILLTFFIPQKYLHSYSVFITLFFILETLLDYKNLKIILMWSILLFSIIYLRN